MKRTILSLTTAIALSIPAVASATSAETAVQQLLTSMGYPASAVETLSNDEIAEIYLSATSDDQSDLRLLIEGMDLPEPAATQVEFMMPEGADMVEGANTAVGMRVLEALMARGYDADDFMMLDDEEKVEVFIAIGSEEDDEVTRIIEGAIAS